MGVIGAGPGGREVDVGVGMAAPAGRQQVLLDHRTVRVVGGANVVDSVAVDADGLVGFLVGGDLLEQQDGRAVKVGDEGVQDIGAQTVLRHQLGIGVTCSAD